MKIQRFQIRFRDGLVWTIGLTVEIKLRFKIAPHSLEGALHNRNVNFILDYKF